MRGLPAPRRQDLVGARVLIVGLGRGGTAAARYLLGRGARVAGWDQNPAAGARLAAAGLRILPANPRALGSFDWAVVSPGIPDTHPLVRNLRRTGVPVVDELDLAAALLAAPLIAITGTNGKSTTTVLVARMLQAAGMRVFYGGNLAPGRPLSRALMLPRCDYYVVEASSFQLARARWLKPHIAVILNISPDHLNRHGTMAAYANAKLRILERQGPEDFAVLNGDDSRLRGAGRGNAAKVHFSVRRRNAEACIAGGWLLLNRRRVIPRGAIRLPGLHNIQNALAATLAARLAGGTAAAVGRVLRTFAGLPHRLELVRTRRGVDYINNSMCTNPAAAVRSLEAVAGGPSRRSVVLIAGGRGKSLPVQDYLRAMARLAEWVVLTGENCEELARRLHFDRVSIAVTLRQALTEAAGRARAGGAVLFSPGFASFDQYVDFQARGAAFRREVKRLG